MCASIKEKLSSIPSFTDHNVYFNNISSYLSNLWNIAQSGNATSYNFFGISREIADRYATPSLRQRLVIFPIFA